MNVDKVAEGPVNPVLWEHPVMRVTLARRDLPTVYRRLQSAGISQRRIAALTGQSPAEISEILNGRQVMAYDVLLRIADGLSIPRGYLGLAYDESTELAVRAISNQHGGARRDAVVAQVRWAQHLLTAVYSDHVGGRLHLALADLHNLAGGTSFDMGLYSAAGRHFARALEQARHADDASLVAKVRYCVGRLHLRRGFHRAALKFSQLRQPAAQDSGSELTVAMLCANEAWAYALMREADQALKSIDREQDGFARAARDNEPVWVRLLRPRRSPRHDGHGLCSAARSRSFRPRSRPSRRRR